MASDDTEIMAGPGRDPERERLQLLLGEDYRLQWVIGHGGMSTVWLADDVARDREVAVKALRPEFSNAPEFLERFRNEAKAATAIDSDHVVATYDYREVTDQAGTTHCFIIMEYVRGETLADLIAREGSLDEELSLDLLEQAAHGLSVIHRLGMIHRDIKPGNLLVTQSGQVKITDFGIAKAAEAVPLTRTGMVVGTAQYISPEQAQGLSVGPPTDVYSLGVVGYEVLGGRRPFSGDSSVSVVLSHINDEPPALPTSISAQARELVSIALRKDPATRFASGDEFALAIKEVRAGNRPPQPASAALQGEAEEPTPSATTELLGQAARPTTILPEATRVARAQETRAAAAGARRGGAPGAKPSAKKKAKKSGRGAGIAAAVAAAALVAAGAWAWSAGVFDSTGGEEPSETIVTTTLPGETETTTVRETAPQQPSRQQEPAPQQPSQQPAPQQPQPSPTAPIQPPPTQPGDDEDDGGDEQTQGSHQPTQPTAPAPTEGSSPAPTRAPSGLDGDRMHDYLDSERGLGGLYGALPRERR